jgi:hypothetical protein
MWKALVSGVIAVISVGAVQPVSRRPVLRLAVVEEGGGLGVDRHNFTLFSSSGQAANSHWFAERNGAESNWCGRRSNGECQSTTVKSHQYIDGDDCAALRNELTGLARVRLKERNASQPVVSDTPLLSLITYGGEGMRTERVAEYVGPLANWWRQAELRLRTCWTSTRPPGL